MSLGVLNRIQVEAKQGYVLTVQNAPNIDVAASASSQPDCHELPRCAKWQII